MLRRILALIKKEFKIIWEDPKSRVLIFIPPILQLFIFAHAATMEIRNIDIGILDKSQTVQSRNFISEFKHSEWFRKVEIIDNEAEIEKLIKMRKIQAGIYINDDFSVNLQKGKSATIQVALDGRQTNTAAIVNGYIVSITQNYQQQFYPQRIKNSPQINVEVRNWFNPNLTFLWYTVASLITILATSIGLMLTAMSIAREREVGTFDQLIVSPLSPNEILIGKTIPPLIISILIVTVMGFCALNLFKIPFTGSYAVFYLSIIIYMMSILGVGLFISSLCKNQQQSILGVFLFQMPAILLSGYISPIEDMPVCIQYLTFINPVRFFLVIIKGLMFKNMPNIYVYENLIPLIIIGAITLIIASNMFQRKLD